MKRILKLKEKKRKERKEDDMNNQFCCSFTIEYFIDIKILLLLLQLLLFIFAEFVEFHFSLVINNNEFKLSSFGL